MLKNASGLDIRFERLLKTALERIPLRYEDLKPLRIFLTGYREAVAASLRCSEAEWHHIVILDRHDFLGRDDPYVLETLVHEIAHLHLGHGKIEMGSAHPKLCEEARKLEAEWGGPRGPPKGLGTQACCNATRSGGRAGSHQGGMGRWWGSSRT